MAGTETVEILKTLVGFSTVSRESNLGLIEWVRDYLVSQGVISRLIYDAERQKANLFATLGEDVREGGIILSGHTDVVPVDSQTWAVDPFKASVIKERIYGRGCADMKGFIAAVLAAVPRILACNRGPPLHLALSYDEEVGCVGVRGLLQNLAAEGIKPYGCIIGEPTSMTLIVGHKGVNAYHCRIQGVAGHSSLADRDANAIVVAARLISELEGIVQRLCVSERAHAGYDVSHTTNNVGVISGGTALNIVPDRCDFWFDIRNLPWTSPEAVVEELECFASRELLPQMRVRDPATSIEVRCVAEVPPLDESLDAPLTRYVGKLCHMEQPSARYVGFATEGGLFTSAGIPAVVLGPGSILQAHKPNEYITLEQLHRCEQFLQRLIEDAVSYQEFLVRNARESLPS